MLAAHSAAPGGLQNFGEFSRKGAAGRLLAIPPAALFAIGTDLGAIHSSSCGLLRHGLTVLALRGLSGICAEQAIFQGCAVEAADNRGHFVSGRRVDEGEALGFLRFVVSDHFYAIGYQIFSGKPLLDVVGSDPRGEIAKKNGKAHSVDFLTPWLDVRHFKGRIPIAN